MKTLVHTYENEIYAIDNTTPEAVAQAMQRSDFLKMPNGAMVAKKSVRLISTTDDYKWQQEQKRRHKQGQYIRGGNWHDSGGIVCSAKLEKITGTIHEQLTNNVCKKLTT